MPQFSKDFSIVGNLEGKLSYSVPYCTADECNLSFNCCYICTLQRVSSAASRLACSSTVQLSLLIPVCDKMGQFRSDNVIFIVLNRIS